MKKREIEERIGRAVDQTTPHVWEELSSRPVTPMQEMDWATRQEAPARRRSLRWVPVLACLLLTVCLAAGWYSFMAADSIVDIDVNPSIELTANRRDRVIRVRALNRDAERILEDMDLRRTDLNVAVNAIVGSMVQKGYMSGTGNAILISVENKDPQKAAALQDGLTQVVMLGLQNRNAEAAVLRQVMPKDPSLEEEAKAHQISQGKMNLIRKIRSVDQTLSVEELSSMSVSEILEYCRRENISLDDDDDDSDDDDADDIDIDDFDDGDDIDDDDDADDIDIGDFDDDNDDADDDDDDDADDDDDSD